MATMSPEEVLLTTMQPTLRALDNRAQGGADFSKAQYLNAVQQANSATDFARRAQEAQRMFALNAGLTRETQKNIADREDQRQENYLERDEQRQKNELEKAEKAQAWLFDRMTAQKKQEKIDEIETILGTLAPEVPKTATLEQKLKLYSDKLSEVVERNLTSIDKNIEAFKKSVAKAAKAQITPEALEAQFVREAIAARVGVTMDESGKPTFLDQAKADELQKRYSQALVASQGNRDTAAQQVFGVSALALRDQLKEQLTEQYQEALLRTPAYAKQLEALVTQRTRMESQSPAANFRKLANSIVLPGGNGADGGADGSGVAGPQGASVIAPDALPGVGGVSALNDPAAAFKARVNAALGIGMDPSGPVAVPAGGNQAPNYTSFFAPPMTPPNEAVLRARAANVIAPPAVATPPPVSMAAPAAPGRTAFGGAPITSKEFWLPMLPQGTRRFLSGETPSPQEQFRILTSQGNRDTAAQQVFGVSALALRDQLKEQLTEQYQEALLRTPAYAKQLEALVTQRTRMESQSPAANFRKLANSIVLPEINNVEAANGEDELLPDPSQFQGGGVINPTAPAWLGEAVLSPELRATPQQAQPTFTPPAITPESIFAPEAINSVAARRALPMGGVVDGGAIIAPQPVPMPFRAKGMGVPGMVNLFNPVSPQNIVNRIYGNAPGGNGLGLGSNIYFGPQPITPDYFTVGQ